MERTRAASLSPLAKPRSERIGALWYGAVVLSSRGLERVSRCGGWASDPHLEFRDFASKKKFSEFCGDARVASVKCPSIILSGSEDGSHKSTFALKEQIPNCAIRILHGAGHACQMEQPWLFDRYIIEFLKDHGLFPVLRQG
jgi:pimeloyl-ACP methyl ester carboxylesterase